MADFASADGHPAAKRQKTEKETEQQSTRERERE